MMLKTHEHTILVVDDDYFQQELLKIWLETEGYHVLVAQNGEQALNYVEQHNIDLVLLDLVMPKMNGFQVAEQLKQNPNTQQIPVVIVSSIDEKEKRMNALKIGVDDFLSKPVEQIELSVRVKNLLQNRDYFKKLQNRQAYLFNLANLASLGTLITSVTKEINKPLQQLKNNLMLAQQQLTNDLVLPNLLANALQDSERIDLVNHNLGLYIKSISAQSTNDRCNVNEVLKQVLELLNYKLIDANIKVEATVPTELPLVQCSSEGLMHVLTQLLINAYDNLKDYSQQAHINITISTTDDKELIVSVSDNNGDIADDIYSLIVDPLFNTKLPGVCEGLKLALACHFLESSGGYMAIDSARGRGCCMKAVLKTV